ncbi:MAG: type II toxin-antitoxin system HicB family antitoxin [Defluviitaleaceae bacterium]|nr:type II toxin-antitoxin system HicB family antitoxin [Defluviitaleaceae bacterium]
MKNLMEYKGYYGSVEYCTEDNIFYGKAVNIRGLISYEGEDLASLKLAFEHALEDYLLVCKQIGREPMKPNIALLREAVPF